MHLKNLLWLSLSIVVVAGVADVAGVAGVVGVVGVTDVAGNLAEWRNGERSAYVSEV